MEDCAAFVSVEIRCSTKESEKSCVAFELAYVMSLWYARCVVLRLENEKEPESGNSCMWEALTASVVNTFK